MSFKVRVGKVGIDIGSHVIYCGRPGRGEAGPFGNPFIIGRDGTRDEVIAKHRKWFNAPEQEPLRRLLIAAACKAADPDFTTPSECPEVILACFCQPKTCHCDVMAEWLRTNCKY